MAVDHTALEVENGFRQFDHAMEVVNYYLEPERPFALRVPLILELHQKAVAGIEADAGKIRMTPVSISQSQHQPPQAHLVQSNLIEFCDYINNNWHEQPAFNLDAYAMWRLNWIHPFSDGNGRTSRTLSYMLLCIKLRYVLPGTPTILQQIEIDNAHYIAALEAADAAARGGGENIREMEVMLRSMLAKQLLSVIDAANGM